MGYVPPSPPARSGMWPFARGYTPPQELLPPGSYRQSKYASPAIRNA